MFVSILRWFSILLIAFIAGKLIKKIKMPAILGWLIVGIFFGPHAIKLMPQMVLEAAWYKNIIMWMQCAFGVMLGSELIWSKLKNSGRPLIVTTLTQSIGTFIVVSISFAIVFCVFDIPIFLAFVFGGIALATAPAPALSIVNEFHAKGPVTDTLLPMTVLDDIVGIAVFFTVNSLVARIASEGALSLLMIPVMIFVPILIGGIVGLPIGLLLKKSNNKKANLAIVVLGITITMLVGWIVNNYFISGVVLNYMLMGVSFSAVFSNMVTQDKLNDINDSFAPILAISLMAAIVDLGAPLDYHLILGAGLFTFVYIIARAFGKYFGARIGAKKTHMPRTVCKYLGFTLLPHSGVSLVFTGIICSTLSSLPDLVQIVQGTIAAAAIINECIAVIVAKKGFELAGEI